MLAELHEFHLPALIDKNKKRHMMQPFILLYIIFYMVWLWTASLNLASLIALVDLELAIRIFGMQNYWMIDFKRHKLSKPDEVRDLIELMARVQQMHELMEEHLRSRNNEALSHKFAQWATYFVYRENQEWTEETELDVLELERIA